MPSERFLEKVSEGSSRQRVGGAGGMLDIMHGRSLMPIDRPSPPRGGQKEIPLARRQW